MSYIFYLPNYVPYSNGIKSLWYVALLFSKERETNIIAFYAGEMGFHKTPEVYKQLLNFTREIKEEDVVIYPDMVEGNPLKAKKVARYLMAKPYILNGRGIKKNEKDFLFSFSRAVDANLPQLTILLPELVNLSEFKKEKKDNTVVLYYGKCRVSLGDTKIKKIIKDFDEIKIVTRTLPADKKLLYEEIARASLFVSYDPLSSLAYEANLLGTPSLILDPVFREYFDKFNHKLFGFFYEYESIKNIDFLALGQNIYEKSHYDLQEMLLKNHANVFGIILQIENWFLGNIIISEKIEKDAIEFYKNKWNMSPIVNCTTIESVIAYNLIRKNIFLYMLATVLYNFKRIIRSLIKKISKKIINAFFLPFEVEVIRYKLTHISKNNSIEVVRCDLVSESIFKLGKNFKSFVWRKLCT